MENKLVKIEKIEKNEISKVIENSEVEIQVANQVTENYQKFFIELGQIQENAVKINFKNPNQIDEKIARELRLATVKIRTSAEGLKNKRKKQYLLRGNLEQSVYNLIKNGCKLIEETFVNVEKAREIAEKKRIENLRLERTEKIIEYVDNVNIFSLGQMSENDFDNLLIGFQVAKEKMEKEEKEAEEKRLAEIEKEKQRQIEIQKENDKLKKEAEERERLLRLEREKFEKERELERKKQSEILAKQKKEAEERERIEREKQAKIQAELKKQTEKERKEYELKLQKERKETAKKEADAKLEREKLQADLKAKQDVEIKQKKEKERIERERIKKEKKAKNAPEKEKLIKFAELIENLQRPEINTDEANKIMNDVDTLLLKVSKFIRDKSLNL